MQPSRTFLLSHWLVIGLVALLVSACGSDRFDPDRKNLISYQHDGLSGRIITRLYAQGDTLLGGTDTGIYRRNPTSGQWQSLGLSQREILDIAILDQNHWLVSTYETGTDVPVYKLTETTNAGASWQDIAHNFGGDENNEAIHGLHYDPDNKALYGTGIEVLAASYDKGRSWQILTGEWQGFGQRKTIVKRNPATNDIWYGGQNALEQMVLRRYSLDTGELTDFPDLLPSPAVIYGIVFDPNKPNRVLVSGEGGVLNSDDNGDTWTTLIGDVDYRFYFNVALDPEDDGILYTAGWDKNWDDPQPLIFEVSQDGGASWKQHQHPSTSLFGGVRSLLARTEQNRTVIYLGLYRGGVMKVTMPKQGRD